MDSKKIVVQIVEKRYFKHRVCQNNEVLGAYLYDFFIELLESIGQETQYIPKGLNHVMFFSQVECTHKNRMFIVNDKTGQVILNFRKTIYNQLELFAEKEREDGKSILIQLNRGEISMKDFDNSI